MIATGASLQEVLANLCAAIDSQDPEIISTVLLADPDGRRLWPAVGPRVPGGWTRALSPLVIGPATGSCGTAAFRGERVIISDVAGDPRWSGLSGSQSREVAVGYGIRAAWSEPVMSKDGELLGTFALYHGRPREPSDRELQMIEDAAHIAVIAIEGERSRERRRQDEQELRRITDAIPHTIVVISPDGAIQYVNRSVLDYTGLTMDVVLAGHFRARVLHPDDVTRLGVERQEALSRGKPFENEQRARRHDGEYRWFLLRYHPVHDDQGRILRWYATGMDIDDRKRAEEQMRNENLALREDIDRASMFEEIVGSSACLREVLVQVAKVAPTDSTVLILGETGTGKELIARAVHKRSPRSGRAFIRVNCAAIAPALVASELFGHERGAFTGALERRLGRFESAEGGTILLDEVAELPPETQVALLRVLQEREFERVGSSHPIAADVRVLAATNVDLDAAVAHGTFREDLYYRLNVFPIRVPPLRERTGDIPLLVEYLVERYARKAGKRFRHISRKTVDLFMSYDWPGNIRELQNVIERAVVLCEGDSFVVDESWLKRTPGRPPPAAGRLPRTLAEQEKAMIEAALTRAGGRVAGGSGAAAKLGIPRQTLDSRIKALGIDKLRFKER